MALRQSSRSKRERRNRQDYRALKNMNIACEYLMIGKYGKKREKNNPRKGERKIYEKKYKIHIKE